MSLPSHQDKGRSRPAALIVGLVVMALLLVVVVLRQQPPAAKGLDAPSDQFSAGRAEAVLQEILAEQVPHPIGTKQIELVRQRIVAAFEALGYEVEVQETVACRPGFRAYAACARVHNIATWLPGQETGPALMLVAHYDSQPASPGVGDDGSSVAEILEVARILKEQGSQRNPILFLITDGEDSGLFGAHGFVDDHPEAEDVAVALNLEARGSTGLSYMFETSEGNAWLIDAYASTVPRPASSSLHYEIYKILPNDTDLTVFREAGMAGMNFAFIGRYSHYHTPLDNFENLDLRSVQHQGDSVLAVAQELAARDLAGPLPGDAAWTDLLGFAIVRWPASWTIPIAVLALLLLLVASGRLVRRGALTVGSLLLGLLAALLTLLLSILIGLGLTLLISLVAGVPSPWYAYPLPTRVAVWAGALLAGGLVSTALARRSGAWGLGLGVWLLWALLALVVSLSLAGVAILFLLPALLAGVLFAVLAFSRLSESVVAWEVSFLAATLAAGVTWLPFALAFESAVSFDLSPTITLALGLVVSILAPLFALPQGQTGVRRWLLTSTTAVMVLASAIAVVVPPYSESDPQRVNLYYFEDRASGGVHWVVSSEQAPVPEPLRSKFDPKPVTVFPWLSQQYLVADAPVTTASAPDLQVLSNELVAGERVVEAKLRSPRGADGISLHLPESELSSIEVADYTFAVDPEGFSNGYYTLECYGLSCDGLEVRLHLRGADPVEVLVSDHSSGLPPEGETLIQARPATAVPSYEGDLTIIMNRVDL